LRRIVYAVFALMLVLTACTPKFEEEEVVRKTDKSKQEAIIPKFQISDSYYRSILPFKPGESRGMVPENLQSRMDISEFEIGLTRMAQSAFPTEQYIFQEGQYLSQKTIESWLRQPEQTEELKKQGKDVKNTELNPLDDGKSPIYLAHILEHNYLVKKDEENMVLGGLAIGLALNSVYPQEEKTTITEKKIFEQGKQMAGEIVSRIRKIQALQDVPIVIALYKLNPVSSITPGNFIARTVVDRGSSVIKNWEEVNEHYAFFPSPEAVKLHKEDADRFRKFETDVSKFFPNYIGVTGLGFYKNNELKELTIQVSMPYYSKAEIIGFTQYATGQIFKHFPNGITVQIYISTDGGQESVIVKEANSDSPFVHIYQ
jgi:protein involved in sex pheromone biosynthesis